MTTFWMTWKPEGWDISLLRELVETFKRDGVANEPWRIIAHKRAKAGDRVFAFKQGKDPRGIFGVGTITGLPSLRPGMSPDPHARQHFAPVRFTQLVDPTERLLLPLDDLIDVVPKKLVEAPASGYPVAPNVAAVIAGRLKLPDAGEIEENIRNPPWNRDELILALDEYVRWNGNPPGKTSADIHDLSHTLNELRRILGTRGQSTLRNANGVYMKLMNFRRLDPVFASQGKSGLTRGNSLEKEVWDEFHGDTARLHHVAGAIRTSLQDSATSGAILADGGALGQPGEAEAVEGRLLTVAHQRRERSRKIVQAKKDASLKATGALVCEVCRFDFAARYGTRGVGFIECHHTKPVADLGDGTPTRLRDLALVCANCHRMIHAHRPWLTVDELRASLLPEATGG